MVRHLATLATFRSVCTGVKSRSFIRASDRDQAEDGRPQRRKRPEEPGATYLAASRDWVFTAAVALIAVTTKWKTSGRTSS